ncbi:MAG TPA: hypothetical protein VF434_05130 [Promineifilum sp.]
MTGYYHTNSPDGHPDVLNPTTHAILLDTLSGWSIAAFARWPMAKVI